MPLVEGQCTRCLERPASTLRNKRRVCTVCAATHDRENAENRQLGKLYRSGNLVCDQGHNVVLSDSPSREVNHDHASTRSK